MRTKNWLICQTHLMGSLYHSSFSAQTNEISWRVSRDSLEYRSTCRQCGRMCPEMGSVLSIRQTSKRISDIKFWHLEFPKTNGAARHRAFGSHTSSRCPLMPTFNEHIFICRLPRALTSSLSHVLFQTAMELCNFSFCRIERKRSLLVSAR